ncbi:MAG: heavy-metal-associated domain-containing protein [Spirochaetota bacterium]
MRDITLQLETLSCPTCAAKINGVLKKTKGVKEVEVLFNTSRVKLSYDQAVNDERGISSVIESLGYGVLNIKHRRS